MYDEKQRQIKSTLTELISNEVRAIVDKTMKENVSITSENLEDIVNDSFTAGIKFTSTVNEFLKHPERI